MISTAKPMTLKGGEVITRHPATGEPGRWSVTGPAVQCGETAEIPVRGPAGQTWISCSVHTVLGVATTHRHDVIAGLRALADWLEDHPDVPVSGDQVVQYWASAGRSPLEARAEVDRIAAALGTSAGRRSPYSAAHVARRRFAGIAYEAVAVGVHPERAR